MNVLDIASSLLRLTEEAVEYGTLGSFFFCDGELCLSTIMLLMSQHSVLDPRLVWVRFKEIDFCLKRGCETRYEDDGRLNDICTSLYFPKQQQMFFF